MTTTDTHCPACLTPTNHPGLCRHCQGEWRHALHAIPLAIQALQLKAWRQTHTSHNNGHGTHATTPQPIDWTAENQIQEITSLLNWIATLHDQKLATETHWTRLLNTILANLPHISQTEQAATAMRTTINTIARTWRMTDPTEDTHAIGECPQCHRPLFAQDSETIATCPACHGQWYVQWLKTQRATRIAQTLQASLITGTPSQLARWTTATTGIRTTGHQVSMWIRRGKLHAAKTSTGAWETTMQDILHAAEDGRRLDKTTLLP